MELSAGTEGEGLGDGLGDGEGLGLGEGDGLGEGEGSALSVISTVMAVSYTHLMLHYNHAGHAEDPAETLLQLQSRPSP